MKKKIQKTKAKKMAATLLTAALILTGLSLPGSPEGTGAAEKVTEITHGEAVVQEELTKKRTKFTKHFVLSDGSFLMNSYSMPVHYKKSGRWKEINTTLVKKNPAMYKTKTTSLGITVAKRANTKAEVIWKRGKSRLSLALHGKKVKARKAKIRNPKKQEKTDILNSNQVQYKKAYKNQTLTYEIYPEKLVEKIFVRKKSALKQITLKVNSGKLKTKVRKNRIYFQTKKGTTRYKRLKTIVTDRKGISTSKVKVKYDKKKKTVTLTPDKKWLDSKKRTYPMTVRTAYVTDQHERDVKIGAAYAGAPQSNYTYNEDLLVQANKCIAFTQMSSLAALGKPDVKVRDARLYVRNEKALYLGAGKTFDIGVHKVTSKWTGKKVTNQKRPAYETGQAAAISLQKKGTAACDVTELVKSWVQGVPNHGVALVSDNSNGSHQAKLGKNPYFSVHYEIVGFDGAVELKENQDITRDVLKGRQENYYYFEPQPGIAYELYTSSRLDTQGILYHADKERLAYDDDSGQEKNFRFVKSDDGRRYLKVNVKGNATGQYSLCFKKRFAIPEPVGKAGQDSYFLSWEAVKNAKEYLVTIYDEKGKRNEVVVTQPSYEYAYTNETAGKTLAFTVTPRESAELKGEASRKIYNTNAASEWQYDAPMNQTRTMFGSAVCGTKIYVLGGMIEEKTATRTLEVFDTNKQTWTKLADYPGSVDGICNMALVTVGSDIYVLGGQTDDTVNARVLSDVYCYHTKSGKWEKKASLPQNRTGMVTAVWDGTIYAFARIGTTERVDVYDCAADTWTSHVKPDTSINVQAQAIDGHIYVLREKQEKNAVKAEMYWEEYLPEEDAYDNAGKKCPINKADRYSHGTVIDGKVYMVKENATDEALCYDAYLDTWNTVPVMNLEKENTGIASVGNTLYTVGGALHGFGYLDVVERYNLPDAQILKTLDVTKNGIYELQIEAGQCKEDTDYVVTVHMDPKVLEFEKTSSFMDQEDFEEGKERVQLLKYAKKSGVLKFKLNGRMETGDTMEAFQSIPVKGLVNGKTTVKMQVDYDK